MMTNSEAIKQLIYVRRNLDEYLDEDRINAVNIAISALEENNKLKAEIVKLRNELIDERTECVKTYEKNTKLKAEIEQLKWKLSSVETQRDLKGYDAKRNADIMSSQLKIIEQLKSELEQSVKLPNLDRMTIRSAMNPHCVWFCGGSYQLEPCEMSNHEIGEVLRRLADYEDLAEQHLKGKVSE